MTFRSAGERGDREPVCQCFGLTNPSSMEWVRRAIERGERIPEEIESLREGIRAAWREQGLPVREGGDRSREKEV